ncbi:hypothetical protein [Agitococcus lubricus]|uniref:Uncharacterized protein n=1 Tax=Agitococcus lubricus TaxID=1077255 RepID=A0A2T5J045_9GAMM|nr:hypothetical protein [Agitococcus lubricus]PTQ89704.1 hypothetical protein C8N29_10527 [Agitococcus lubricus]
MTLAMPSRLWVPVGASLVALLLIDVAVIAVKGRSAPKEPTIQDVFVGETHEFSSDLGQLPSIVPFTNYVATPPENHGPQYRTADWLKAQGSMAWTLQVMVSTDEEQIKSYIAQRDDKEQYAYFMYKNGDIVEFRAVYGNYVTMELALGVADTKDFALPEGTRVIPERFINYVPYVPLIQPAIDRPPPPKYEGVPEVPVDSPDVNTEPTTLTPSPEDGTNNANQDSKEVADPF